MVMMILEAQVAPEQWVMLEAEFHKAVAAPERRAAGLDQCFLLHSTADPSVWRILSVWRSHEALDATRSANPTPVAVQMFRAAGAEPTLSIFDIPVSFGGCQGE